MEKEITMPGQEMPQVRGFFDPATATWTYVVWPEGGLQCAIIDSVLDYDAAAGRLSTASADRVAFFIKKKNLAVEWILETHIHADHLTAAKYLKEKLGGKIGISRHILEVIKTWEPVFKSDTPATGAQFDHLFADDEDFSIGRLSARLIHTPGHTPADSTFLIGGAAFVGDAMFLPDVGTGRCDFPGGSAADSYDSTRKILSLPEATRIYVGHDYPPATPSEEGVKPRGPQCMATVTEQKAGNILAATAIAREAFIQRRTAADEGKNVPPLLLPSLQVNLRGGAAGDYLKIPVNAL